MANQTAKQLNKATNGKQKQTRIQQRNIALILEAALEVFSQYGFRGTTLDQIAKEAGLSKPNLLYYFKSKEDIHERLLTDLVDTWLEPLRRIDPAGEPQQEIMRYVHRKLQMSQDFPRESRLFASEILNGTARLEAYILGDLKTLVDGTVVLLRGWMEAGKIRQCDPYHLIFSIWALTQHYADFSRQVSLLLPNGDDPYPDAALFLDQIYGSLLSVPE